MNASSGEMSRRLIRPMPTPFGAVTTRRKSAGVSVRPSEPMMSVSESGSRMSANTRCLLQVQAAIERHTLVHLAIARRRERAAEHARPLRLRLGRDELAGLVVGAGAH